MLDTAGGSNVSDSSSGVHLRACGDVDVDSVFSQQPLRMESEASVPVYTKCRPVGILEMPWKLCEELKDTRSMPTKVLGGRSRNRRVEEIDEAMGDSTRGVNAVHLYGCNGTTVTRTRWSTSSEFDVSHSSILACAKCILKTRQTRPFFAYFEHHEPAMATDTPPVPPSHRRRPRRPPLRRVESDGVGVTSSILPIFMPERAKARSAD